MLEYMAIIMFVIVCLVLLLGFPVAFSLGGTALIFALIGHLSSSFDADFLSALPNRLFGIMTNETLIAVPLFVFMGVMLERSKVADNLLTSMSDLFGQFRGGLAISVVIVGMLLAASTGIVGATVVTMGLLSLPTMLKRGYDPAISTGTICAAGTLGQIIPPSIILVLLGDVLSSAYQQAQLDMGIFSPETISVGDLFAGALIPGILLVGLYIAYIVFRAYITPQALPQAPVTVDMKVAFQQALKNLLPPMLLIFAVLGSILSGAATPTEAASVGAVGAMLLALLQQANSNLLKEIFYYLIESTVLISGFVCIYYISLDWRFFPSLLLPVIVFWQLRKYRPVSDVMKTVMVKTMEVTAMVFMILVGASIFSLVFRGFGGDELVQAWLSDLPGGVFGAMLIVMLIMFLLGFVLDFIEITFVVVPIVGPVLLAMGLDPVWLGIMIALNLQTSFLTPPFGFALFYLRGVAHKSVSTLQIYRGVMPFIVLQIVAIAAVAYWPALATWLPSVIFAE